MSASCPACGAAKSGPSYLGEARFREFRYRYLACAACGSLFVDPMPDEGLLDSHYGPGYVEENYQAELGGEATHEELGRELEDTAARIARDHPGARLLDVGCGAGRFLAVAREAGLRAEGFERVAATAELTARTTGVPVHTGALADVPGRFDVVHFADVLEHLPRPLDVLVAARRLLADGGVVVARGPLQNHATLFQRTLAARRTLRRWLGSLPITECFPGHVVLFTLAGWHALLDRAHLAIVDERVGELHWPAPEVPMLSSVSLVKEASLALSRSPLGRKLQLGDRVVTVARPER